jgi:hypothetical protein
MSELETLLSKIDLDTAKEYIRQMERYSAQQSKRLEDVKAALQHAYEQIVVKDGEIKGLSEDLREARRSSERTTDRIVGALIGDPERKQQQLEPARPNAQRQPSGFLQNSPGLPICGKRNCNGTHPKRSATGVEFVPCWCVVGLPTHTNRREQKPRIPVRNSVKDQHPGASDNSVKDQHPGTSDNSSNG